MISFYDNDEERPREVSKHHPLPVKIVGSSFGGDAQSEHVLEPRTFTNDAGQQTGTMPDHTGKLHVQTSWQNDAGNTSLSVTVPKGYYPGGEENLRVQSPGLIPENIVSGKTIFGVTGTAESFNPVKSTVQTNVVSFGPSDDEYVLVFASAVPDAKDHILGLVVKLEEEVTWEYEAGKNLNLDSMTFNAFVLDNNFVARQQQINLDGTTLDTNFGNIILSGGQLEFDIIFTPNSGSIDISNDKLLISVDIWTY